MTDRVLSTVRARFHRPTLQALPALLVAAAIVGYIAWFSYVTIRNHDGFATFGFDFGIYDQGLWLLSHFHAPFITIMGRNLFGDHTSFILLPLVPLYWIDPSAHLLMVVQAGAMGLTAWPVYLLARRWLEDAWLALVLALAVLMLPTLEWTNLEQFHPDCFEPMLIGFALYFLFEHRWTPYFIFVALELSVKEDTPLVVIVIGLYVAIRHNRKVGLITAAAALGYGLFAVYGILKILNGVGSLNGWRLPFGGPTGFIRTSFSHPNRLGRYLTQDNRPFYLWQLFAPFALAPLGALDVAILAIGPIASNEISDFYYQHRIEYHYTAVIVAPLAAATILAVRRLRRPTLQAFGVGTVLAATLASAYLWGPQPWSLRPTSPADPNAASLRDVRHAISLVPSGASVSAFYGYVTHLDHRTECYEFPVPWRAVNWGTFKQEGQRLPMADHVQYVVVPPQIGDATTQAVLDSIKSQFTVIYETPNVEVLKRR